MAENMSGFVPDAVLLALGRHLMRKQERDNRKMNDTEALGHAQVLQGRYGFVEPECEAQFPAEVLRAFRYVEQRQVPAVSKTAYLQFAWDEKRHRSPLWDPTGDGELTNDLKPLGPDL